MKRFSLSLISLMILVGLIGCGNKVSSEVEMVKEGTLDMCPNVKLGTMIDDYFQSPTWESLIAEDSNVYVNVNGNIYFEGKEANALVQFRINPKNNTFEYNAFEIDGAIQDNNTATVLFREMCKDDQTQTTQNTADSKAPVRVRTEQAYNQAYDYYYPKVVITSLVDTTTIKNVSINKGRCKFSSSDLIYKNGKMKQVKLLPRTLGYGEELEIRLKECNVLRVKVTTDNGEWLVEY